MEFSDCADRSGKPPAFAAGRLQEVAQAPSRWKPERLWLFSMAWQKALRLFCIPPALQLEVLKSKRARQSFVVTPPVSSMSAAANISFPSTLPVDPVKTNDTSIARLVVSVAITQVGFDWAMIFWKDNSQACGSARNEMN